MTDDSLAALWALDQPPAQDPAFVLAVLDRLARRRFRIRVVRLVPPLVATIAVCWAIAPSVDAVLGSGGVAVATAIGLALTAQYAGDVAHRQLM